MGALPSVLPDVAFNASLRLPADHWVRHQAHDYSVSPRRCDAGWRCAPPGLEDHHRRGGHAAGTIPVRAVVGSTWTAQSRGRSDHTMITDCP